MRFSIRCLAVLAIALMIPALVAAQTESGKISGSVTDQSGAVLPGVTVNLKSVERATMRSTVTNAQGEYVFASLVPGNYEVTAELSGFSTQQTRTNVPVGATVAVNVQMAVGAQTEVITVVGETAAAINTSTQDIATTVNQTQIRELPTITRNPYDLVQLSGQASRDTESDRGTGYAINGARSASTNILLDGSSNNDDFTATVGQAVPLDSVQEFSVLTSNFSAQYGRASGGVVNVATKSGTNQIRGTVYEFFRSDALAANSFDNNANEIAPGRVQAQPDGLQPRRPRGEGQGPLLHEPRVHPRPLDRHGDQLGPDARVHRGQRRRDAAVLQRLRQRREHQRPDPHPRRRLRDRGHDGRPVQLPAGGPARLRPGREVAPDRRRWRRPAGPVPVRRAAGLQPEHGDAGVRPLRLPEPGGGAGHQRLEPVRRLRHRLPREEPQPPRLADPRVLAELHQPDEGGLEPDLWRSAPERRPAGRRST